MESHSRPPGDSDAAESAAQSADGTELPEDMEVAKPDVEVSPDGEGASELSRDVIFELLKNSRRRHVVRLLKDWDDRVTLSDLAEHVAAIENDTTVQALDSQQRKRVYVGLYQVHLPKLDDTDVISFDSDRGTVELGPAAPQLDRYLSVDEDGDERSVRPYGEAVAVSTLVIAGGATVGAIEPVTAIGVVLAIVVGVAWIAAFRVRNRRT